MEETRKFKVHPSDEQTQTEIRQDFGWTLVSSQEINSKESHLERSGDTLYSVTTKENYVNLLFKRDTNMPNYAAIKQLEGQYDAVPENQTPYFGKLMKILVIAAIVLIICGIAMFSNGSAFGGILCLLLAAGAITGAVFKSKANKKLEAEINAKNSSNDEQRAELRRKSRALLV